MAQPKIGSPQLATLLKRVVRYTRKVEDAEDSLQSAFVRMLEYRERHVVDNEGGFLVRAAINLATDEARRRRARPEDGDATDALSEIVDDLPLQDEVIAARQRLTKVRAALEQLSPRTREIFLMHRLDGLKYREIAEQLGITMSAVEKHMAKASLLMLQSSRTLADE